MFDPENKIVRLCGEGMYKEGNPEEAAALFNQAWDEASTDFEKFVAAHYMARQQDSVAGKLQWDETALSFAMKVNDDAVKSAYPSLYLNIAKCYEDLNDYEKAKDHYEKALSFIEFLPEDGFSNFIKNGIANGLKRITIE